MRFSAIRRFYVFMIAWTLVQVLSGAVFAEEKKWTYHRIDSLYIEVPDSWSSYSEKKGTGFYTGKPPTKGVSVGSLVVLAGREKTDQYQDIVASLKRAPGGALEMDFQEEERSASGRDAVLFTSTLSRREQDGSLRAFIKMRGVVWKDAAQDGVLILVAGGDAALFEEHGEDLERMIASVRFDEPSLDDLLELPPITLPPPGIADGKKEDVPGAEKEEKHDIPDVEKPEKTLRDSPVFASDSLLEAEILKMRSSLTLRDEGALLLAKGDREGALECFRQSLELVPDEDLASYIEAAGQRESEEKKAEEGRASLLRREGFALQQQGLWREALGKYRESLVLNDEEDLRDIVRGLEKLLRERASALVAQGEAHEGAGHLEDALAAYEESVSWYDEETVRRRIDAVERLIQERREANAPERILAGGLWNEGKALEEQGRSYEALGKYRESLKSHEDHELTLHADALESSLKERAGALVREGAALQRDAKFAEALLKFRESLKYFPRKEVEAHIEKLEEFLKK